MYFKWLSAVECSTRGNVTTVRYCGSIIKHSVSAFSALTLLFGRQEEHRACKNQVMRCWCGYLFGARCRLFAYGSVDATAISKPPSSLASYKSRQVLPFWYWLTDVVLEKRPLNGCSIKITVTDRSSNYLIRSLYIALVASR